MSRLVDAQPSPDPQQADADARLLLVEVHGLLTEQQRPRTSLSLDSHLERDLNLDSLGRSELVRRLEQRTGSRLPETALEATTLRELLTALLGRHGADASAVLAHFEELEPPGAEPQQARNLLEVLDYHRRHHPDRPYLYLYENDDQPHIISYAELWQRAAAVAAYLSAKGLERRGTVALMLPTGVDYFVTFFGVLLAGGVPVPLYPPLRPSQLEDHLQRHARILASAQARFLITIPAARALAHWLDATAQRSISVITPAELPTTPLTTWTPPSVQAEDLAFVQYTSGSTGDPKGVMLSHANLLANIRAAGKRVRVQSDDVFVSWLPLYHDMGLIGGGLFTLYFAIPVVILSPISFLQRPICWLQAIHRHRGTLSAAPNFAFELCLKSIDDDAMAGLDLSSWRYLLNGAEPVSATTMRRFGDYFRRWGFDPKALAPSYGLAECSVALALPEAGRGLQVDTIQRSQFLRRGVAAPSPPDSDDVSEIVACGQAIPGHQIRIIDEQGNEQADRYEGLLQFRGPSTSGGYLNNPAASDALFDGPWLHSGDRAYLDRGTVYLTGRVKDLIIRGGRNLYPYELEQAVGDLEGIRKGCVAVFASNDPDGGTERLVVVAETRETDAERREQLLSNIRNTALSILDTPPEAVVLAPPHSVLKTSSGKIRRSAVRERYEQGLIGHPGHQVWWQLLRLTTSGALGRSRRLGKILAERLYNGYVWGLCTLVIPLSVLALLITPKAWAWAISHRAMRLLLAASGIPFQVKGIAALRQPAIIVVNHSSYLDALIVVAALPTSVSFVAKRELGEIAPLRWLLQRLDTLLVDRFSVAQSSADGHRVTQAVIEGKTVVVFPEGTFGRIAGILPFKTGAFTAACQADRPVIPMVLRGTRQALHPGGWLLRRRAVTIEILPALYPQGTDWHQVIGLRDQVRRLFLEISGDPDLRDEDSPLTSSA